MALIDTLGEVIERNERYFRDEICLIFDGRRISFGEYADRVRRLADGLYKIGLRRQDRVAILSANRPEFVDLYGACEWAGYVIAPLNNALAAPEIAYVLNDVAPQALLFESQFSSLVDSIRGTLPDIKTFVCVDDDAPSWATSCKAIMEVGSPAGPPIRALAGDDLAVFYTSGTTGRPKGAVHTHTASFSFAQARVMETGCNLGDRALAPMPLYHTAARSNQLSHHLRAATVVLLSRSDPELLLRTIERERATTISVAPTMLQMMFDTPGFDNYDLSSLRTIVYAGAPMPLPLLTRGMRKFGPVFMSVYAQTESGGTCLRKHHHRIDGTPKEMRRLLSVGQPYLGTRIKIVDDNDNEMPDGTPGEVCFKSDCVMDRYWQNEEATGDALRDGWLHTGDIGHLDADGFLFLVDRKKDMIISGGNNIYSKEVEDVLLRYPAVERAAVIGVADPFWGETVRAIIVRRPGMTVSEDELIAFCKPHIARYKCPANITFIDEMPMLATGKVHKPTLRERYGQPKHYASAAGAPGSTQAAEDTLKKIWSSVLQLESIDSNQNFFELGGDSLAALQLSLEVEKQIGRVIPISLFYSSPTIAGNVALIRSQNAIPFDDVPRVAPGAGGDGIPLSWSQQRIFKIAEELEQASAYNTAFGYRISGDLNREALRASIDYVMNRHEILRTTFEVRDGRPVQIVHPPARVELSDLGLEALIPEDDALELFRSEARRPFDLKQLPLTRFSLVQIEPDLHFLLRVEHHIVSDERCPQIFFSEVAAAYEALIASDALPLLDPVELQYSDYAVWQRTVVDSNGARYRASLDWWTSQYRDVPESTALPFKREAAIRGLDPETGRIQLAVGQRVQKGLRQLARKNRSTPFSTCLAAYVAILAVEAKTNDVCLGTYVTSRGRAEFENMIGMFVNLTTMRFSYDLAMSFTDWLMIVGERVRETQEHGWIPYEKLDGALAQDGIILPEITTIFGAKSMQMDLRFAGIHLTELASQSRYFPGAMPWGLSVSVDWRYDGMIHAAFDAGIYKPSEIRRVLARFKRFLETASDHPELSLETLLARSEASPAVEGQQVSGAS